MVKINRDHQNPAVRVAGDSRRQLVLLFADPVFCNLLSMVQKFEKFHPTAFLLL